MAGLLVEDDAEAVIEETVAGGIVIAISGAALSSGVTVRSPAHHAVANPGNWNEGVFDRVRTIRLGPAVETPLKDVAVHVIQTPSVGLLCADRVCLIL